MVKEITAIVQARLNASRLPGKVLMKISGETVLFHVTRRIGRAKNLSGIIVATTSNPADDAVESECRRLSIPCFRGSEPDVLERFYTAAKEYKIPHIMRICADNPLLEPALLDDLAVFYRKNTFSYVRHEKTPLGLAAEIFTFERLEEAARCGKEDYHREHVTPYMYEDDIDCGRLYMEPDLSSLRFTMDTPEDFRFMQAVYDEFAGAVDFSLDDVTALLRKKPELLEINRGIVQRSCR